METAVPDLEQLSIAIQTGDRTSAVKLTTEAVAEGMEPQVMLGAMTRAMSVVGGRFQRGEIYVPEMLIVARAMKEATAVLEPVLVAPISDPSTPRSLGPLRETSTTSARTW
jgi:5-methyltetrahydrofolate--homocysteine methyltransferase